MGKFGIGLRIVSGAVAIWFLSLACIQGWRYGKLERAVPAQIEHWSVHKKGSNFLITARYQYKVGGKIFKGKYRFTEIPYMNTYAAQKDISYFRMHPWKVWYNAKKPAYCSLEKNFPYKKLFQACIAIAIFFYFHFLLLPRHEAYGLSSE